MPLLTRTDRHERHAAAREAYRATRHEMRVAHALGGWQETVQNDEMRDVKLAGQEPQVVHRLYRVQ